MRDKGYLYGFITIGMVIQGITFSIMPHDSWLSLLSGCLGICSVCLAAQGNILTFAFGFAQVITYTILCVSQRFYGEIGINLYYFITMIYGVYVWKKRLSVTGDGLPVTGDGLEVRTRSLSPTLFAAIIAATLAGSVLTGWGLHAWTDDPQPFLDAFTTVPALVAQILMILVYREHWCLWLAVDILSVVLWLRAGDYCMVAQYTFWCINCLYGWIHWKKTER